MLRMSLAARFAALVSCGLSLAAPAWANELTPGTRLCALDAHKKLFDLSMAMHPRAKPGSREEAENQKIVDEVGKLQAEKCIFVEAKTTVTLTGKKTTTYDEFHEVEVAGKKLWVSATELGL